MFYQKKHEQALATDARSYIYLVQDNEIDKVKKIVKQQKYRFIDN